MPGEDGLTADITAWLRAQFDNDEAEARRLLDDVRRIREQLREVRLLGTEQPGHYRWPDVERMARSVLADLAAKRAILDAHKVSWTTEGWDREIEICGTCRYDDGMDWYAYPCPTVRLLASVYADRPGYREEWRPV